MRRRFLPFGGHVRGVRRGEVHADDGRVCGHSVSDFIAITLSHDGRGYQNIPGWCGVPEYSL